MNKYFTDLVDFVGSRPRPFKNTKKYVSTGALKTDYISENDIEVIDYTSRPSRADLEVNAGDILFAKMAYTDKRLLVSEKDANHIYSTGFYAIRPKQGIITTKCLYYLLNSETFRNQKDSNSTGATQKAITIEGLKKIQLSIPEYNKQNQIGIILENMERIIKYKQNQLFEYDQLIKSRFVEMFGEVSQKENGFTLNDVCVKMVRGPFGSSLKKEYFVPEGSTTYKVYEQKHAINREINIGDYYIDSQKFDELKRFEVKPGDVIMSCSGTIGKFFVIPSNAKPGIINQALLNFKLNDSLINHDYFLQSMYSIISTIESKGSGIANITSVNNIKKTNLFLPALIEQNEFSTFVRQVDKLKFAVQQSLNETQSLFDSLMQTYFG
jgi:type I restriction enzyme, S subunit